MLPSPSKVQTQEALERRVPHLFPSTRSHKRVRSPLAPLIIDNSTSSASNADYVPVPSTNGNRVRQKHDSGSGSGDPGGGGSSVMRPSEPEVRANAHQPLRTPNNSAPIRLPTSVLSAPPEPHKCQHCSGGFARDRVVCSCSTQFVVALKKWNAERAAGWIEWLEQEMINKKLLEERLEELLDQQKKLFERLGKDQPAELKKREKSLRGHVGTAVEGEALENGRKRKSTTNERGEGKSEKNKWDVEGAAGALSSSTKTKNLFVITP